MKIKILSDLHLEFADFSVSTDDCDIVILAGDIHIKNKGLDWALRNIPTKPVLYALGNHEYYGKSYPKHMEALKEESRGSNVHILENDRVTIDGINFFGCTLWTDFELFGDPRTAGYHCQQIMTDYKKIRILPNYSKLRSLDVAVIHRRSLTWLGEALSERAGQKNIVITHHGPSIQSLPEHKSDDLASAAYVSHLDDFVKKHSPNYWIHGHLHKSSDYQLGACRVICNSRGYPDEPNPQFNPMLTVDI